jgi:hypothetical protein
MTSSQSESNSKSGVSDMIKNCKGIFGLRDELDKAFADGKIVTVLSVKNSWYKIQIKEVPNSSQR